MRVSGEHAFSATRAQVWEALQDPDILAATVPGARRLAPTGPDVYELAVDVGVGSVTGTYEGTFSLTDRVEGEACTVRADASGRPGTVTAVARMRLADGDGGATLAYDADATVTGPLAGVGQRLMAAAARRTTEQFLAALDDRIAAPAAPAPAGEIERAPATPARRGAAPAVIAVSALAGFALALIGVAVARWSARR
jgi:carbon monoxide dehydrogenase subunit G